MSDIDAWTHNGIDSTGTCDENCVIYDKIAQIVAEHNATRKGRKLAISTVIEVMYQEACKTLRRNNCGLLPKSSKLCATRQHS